VHCLLIFPVLLCVFIVVACLMLYGIESALLAFIAVMSFHTTLSPPYVVVMLTVSIAIAILRYEYKLALNTIVIKLFVVGTCEP
jgi:hypothetical protein